MLKLITILKEKNVRFSLQINKVKSFWNLQNGSVILLLMYYFMAIYKIGIGSKLNF